MDMTSLTRENKRSSTEIDSSSNVKLQPTPAADELDPKPNKKRREHTPSPPNHSNQDMESEKSSTIESNQTEAELSTSAASASSSSSPSSDSLELLYPDVKHMKPDITSLELNQALIDIKIIIPNPQVMDPTHPSQYILNPDWHKNNQKTNELRQSAARLIRGRRGLDTRQLCPPARHFIMVDTNELAYSDTPEGRQFLKDLDPIHLMVSLDEVNNPGVYAWPPVGVSQVLNAGKPNQGEPVAGQDIHGCSWDNFLDQLSTQLSPGPHRGTVGCVVGPGNIVPVGQLAASGLPPSVMYRLPPSHGLTPNVIVADNQSVADKIVAQIASYTNNNRVVTYLTTLTPATIGY